MRFCEWWASCRVPLCAATAALVLVSAAPARGSETAPPAPVVELVSPQTPTTSGTSPAPGAHDADRDQITRLLLEFRSAAQEQDLPAIGRMFSPTVPDEQLQEQLAKVRESLWLPMYRDYGLRVEEALTEADPEDLARGELRLRITVDTPAGDREHDEFRLVRGRTPGGERRWFFRRLKLERPRKGEYLTIPLAEAEQVLGTVEAFVEALDAGDAEAALGLASPRLSSKERRDLAEEIDRRFLRRYLYRSDLRSGRPRREPGSVRYLLVVSQQEAPGSIFRYYDHGRIAVPFNLHYLKPRTVGPYRRLAAEEKVKKYALVFRWTEPSAAGQPQDDEAPGRWELVDTTRRDKGFWRGVGRVFTAIGRGTVEVGAGILGDLPRLVPSSARISVVH